MISLKAKIRKEMGRKTNDLRASDRIPAVVYGHKVKNILLDIDYKEFQNVLRKAGESSLIELEVEADGLMGHVDCYDKEEKSVMDWKTTTKKNMSKFPTDQQKMQVQLYGYLLTCNGYEVDTVTLVAIPRDGNELDIRQHSEPYDESVALSGLEWLHNVRHMQEPPAPEKHKRFCQDYCGFFGSVCEGG